MPWRVPVACETGGAPTRSTHCRPGASRAPWSPIGAGAAPRRRARRRRAPERCVTHRAGRGRPPAACALMGSRPVARVRARASLCTARYTEQADENIDSIPPPLDRIAGVRGSRSTTGRLRTNGPTRGLVRTSSRLRLSVAPTRILAAKSDTWDAQICSTARRSRSALRADRDARSTSPIADRPRAAVNVVAARRVEIACASLRTTSRSASSPRGSRSLAPRRIASSPTSWRDSPRWWHRRHSRIGVGRVLDGTLITTVTSDGGEVQELRWSCNDRSESAAAICP